MLVVGIIFLCFAVLFGVIILRAIFKGKKTPKPMVFLHGAIALFAILVIAGYVIAGHTEPLLIATLILFIVAALGGVTLVIFDLKNKPMSLPIVLIHPLIAVAGIITLVTYLIKMSAN